MGRGRNGKGRYGNKSLEVGNNFSSFLKLQEALSKYCHEQYTETYIWDGQRTWRENKNLYHIKYGCVRGGTDFKARGKGKRNK